MISTLLASQDLKSALLHALVTCCALISCCALAACAGAETKAGVDTSIRVHGAQFQTGTLPGVAPLTTEEQQAGVLPSSPYVTTFSLNASLAPGTPGVALQGRASPDSVAVGLGLPSAGAGYWVLPVGAPDPSFEGEYGWSANFDVGHSLAPGLHDLVMVGIDALGRAGTQVSTRLCVDSLVPSNLNVCVPKRKPPETVVSLSWDAPVDLDLVIFTPAGKWVDAKHPTTAARAADGKPGMNSSSDGVLQQDGGASCAARGRFREDLVFVERPASGSYAVYANLFSACGQASVRFQLEIWTAVEADEPGTYRQHRTYAMSGIQLAAQANAGTARGQFLTELTVE